jgi:hypothetical protein
MTFVYFVLRPALSRRAEEAGIRPVASFVRARFRWIAILLTAVIIASGIVHVVLAPPRGWYIALLIVTVLVGATVLWFYFRNAFAKTTGPTGAESLPPPPANGAGVNPPDKTGEWRTRWLLEPTDSQLNLELILIGGAFVFVLLNIILMWQ